MSIKKCLFDTFENIWDRTQKATELKTIKELGELVGKTGNNISQIKRKTGEFDPEWAILLEKKYGVSAYWIMTGEGPIRREKATNNDFAVKLARWIEEIEKENPEEGIWARTQIKKCLPEFKKWLENPENELH